MPLTPWAPPLSASPTMAASSSAPIPEPAPVFMLRTEHPIRSLSSLTMSTCVAPDRLLILKLCLIMCVTFFISTPGPACNSQGCCKPYQVVLIQ